jgi:hypothetical protein
MFEMSNRREILIVGESWQHVDWSFMLHAAGDTPLKLENTGYQSRTMF